MIDKYYIGWSRDAQGRITNRPRKPISNTITQTCGGHLCEDRLGNTTPYIVYRFEKKIKQNIETMKTEDNNRMEALAYIIADLKAENMELEQCVHQLVDDYNDVVRQLRGMEKRKDDPEKQMLGNMLKMRDHCDKLERMNGELKRFAKAIHTFVKDKNLYMEKGVSCGYMQGHPAVSSMACLECDSCLGIIEGCGVICQQVLLGLKIHEKNIESND